MNVRPNELAFTLTFDAVEGTGMTGSAGDDEFAVALLGSLRQLHGLPHRMTRMLRERGTTVAVAATEGTALLKMQQPPAGAVTSGTVEAMAMALQLKADRGKITIGGVRVRDVAVAVPQRVPKEINRRSVLRLEVLGEVRLRCCGAVPRCLRARS